MKLRFVLPGLVGGLAKLVADTTFDRALLSSPWDFLRRTAALGLGSVPSSSDFGVGQAFVGLLVHFALAIGFGAIFVALTERVGRGLVLLLGIAFGLGLYLVNLHLFTFVFPWFVAERGLAQVLAHGTFGLVAGLVTVAVSPRPAFTEEPRAPISHGHHQVL